MNKNQMTGMYIVLGIVILLFASSVFMSSPTTKTEEISYTNFLQKLDNNEFNKVQKADDFLIAIPKNQPEVKQTTVAPTLDNPFGVPQAKAPALKYKVLTPNYDPDLMKRLNSSDADIEVTRASDSSKTFGNLLSYLLLPILFLVFLGVMAKSIQAGGSQAMSFGKSKARMVGEHDKNKVTFKDVAGVKEEKVIMWK